MRGSHAGERNGSKRYADARRSQCRRLPSRQMQFALAPAGGRCKAQCAKIPACRLAEPLQSSGVVGRRIDVELRFGHRYRTHVPGMPLQKQLRAVLAIELRKLREIASRKATR